MVFVFTHFNGVLLDFQTIVVCALKVLITRLMKLTILRSIARSRGIRVPRMTH